MKKRTTKLMALLISVIMLTALLPMVALAADETEITVGTRDELLEAVNNASGPTTILINQDIDFGGGGVNIPQDKHITIKSVEGEVFSILGWTATYSVNFWIWEDATLILENIALIPRGSGAIVVDTGGTLVIEPGVLISEFPFMQNGTTGAIEVRGGTVIMNGGEISNNSGNHGGGICNNDGTVIINGGIISGNSVQSAGNAGGGIYNRNGTVTINGGEISGNTANYGGGIYNGNGTVIINGGEISGNTAVINGGGIYNENGTVIINGGEISGNTAVISGGGIKNSDSGTVDIFGGIIQNNNPDNIDGGTINDNTNPCADGHSFVDNPDSEDYLAPACTEPGFMPTICSVCGEAGDGYAIPALGHNWNRGVVTVKPTAWSDGEKLFTCKNCGDTYTIVLPKLTVNGVSADAFVEKQNGNKNSLTIIVTELVSKAGSKMQTEVTYTETFSINNNAAGTYQVGPYKVYVDTKGNTQIREIRIVE